MCRHCLCRLANTWRGLNQSRYVLACEEQCHNDRKFGHSNAVAYASTVRTVLQRLTCVTRYRWISPGSSLGVAAQKMPMPSLAHLPPACRPRRYPGWELRAGLGLGGRGTGGQVQSPATNGAACSTPVRRRTQKASHASWRPGWTPETTNIPQDCMCMPATAPLWA